MIIYARSPYFINVALTAGFGSKINLFLANGTDSLPTQPTYEIVKDYNQSTATSHNYNISNFIREYIQNVSYFYTPNENFVKVKVETYRQNSDLSYTKLATLEFLGTNGYTLFTQGASYTDPSGACVLLSNPNIENYYHRDGGFTPRMGILVNSFLGDKLEVTLTDLSGGNSVTTTLIGTTTPSTKAILEAVLSDFTNPAYNKGNYCRIKYYTGSTLAIDETIKLTPICEPKYTPVRCYFINRFGGWQVLFFFKAQSNSINVSGTSYNMLPSSVEYNTRSPQTAIFNVNGKQNIKLNTGWVPQNYSELIQDLLLSETVLLDDKPVQVRTQGSELKTSLKDRNINYEIDFEYAYNLINNVV